MEGTVPRYVLTDSQIYFRVSPITASKPYNPKSQSKKPSFQDDDPDFTLCNIGDGYKLILNKFCWLRPQLILHTVEFQSQRDLLTQPDFDATWEALKGLGDRYLVVFNGGPDAGSSVAHKHLQLFPRPEWKTFADRIAEGSWREHDKPGISRSELLTNKTQIASLPLFTSRSLC